MNRLWLGIVTVIASAGASLGYAASGNPVVLISVFAGMVCLGAGVGIGVGLAIGLMEGVRHVVRVRMGVPDSERLF